MPNTLPACSLSRPSCTAQREYVDGQRRQLAEAAAAEAAAAEAAAADGAGAAAGAGR